MRGRILLVVAFALGTLVGGVTAWQFKSATTRSSPLSTIKNGTITKQIVPLGQSRQQLMDALAASYPTKTVQDDPMLYAATLADTEVAVAFDGPAEHPERVSVTAFYNQHAAQHLATSARLLAAELVDDVDEYGSWVGEAIHKCEPWFDTVGTLPARDSESGIIEIRLSKPILDGQQALSIGFRRLK